MLVFTYLDFQILYKTMRVGLAWTWLDFRRNNATKIDELTYALDVLSVKANLL